MLGATSPRLWLVPLRPVVWLLLLVHLASAVGAPIPAVQFVSAWQRFPCEGHGCGCASAEQCWEQCCCFTTAQKLAWASANGVTPPDGLQAAETEPSVRSCCSAGKAPTTCASPSEEPTSCETVETAVQKETTWQLALRAQRCRGEAGTWLHAEPSVIPPPIEISPAEAPCIERLALLPESALSPTILPAVPPPRSAAQFFDRTV